MIDVVWNCRESEVLRLGATASQRLELAVVLPRRHWPSYYNFTYLGAEAATVQPPEQRAASAGPHGLGSICLEDGKEATMPHVNTEKLIDKC